MKTKTNYKWVIRITVISIIVSMTFALASSRVLGSLGYVMAFVVLAIFIVIGILFDIIGVSVTAASEKPFHSMASHKEHGAVEAIRLIRNAEKVSSFCNDVIGDISGIISGTTSALIVTRLVNDLSLNNVVMQLLISGLVTGATVGGKAAGKALAINNCTSIVLDIGKLLESFFRLIGKK